MSSPSSTSQPPNEKTTKPNHTQAYPGLEVYQDHTGLEAFPVVDPPDDHTQKQVSLASNQTREDRYLQPCIDRITSAHVNEHVKGEDEPPAAKATNMPETKKATFLGLRRRTWWAVFGITTVLVIAAIVGGVVGGLLTQDDSKPTSSTEQPPASPSIAVHMQSKLAASNWTDSNGLAHNIVYFQDEYGYLIARHKILSDTEVWSTINVTASVPDTVSLPGEGTTLAAAASPIYYNTVSISLFYISATGHTHNLWSDSLDAGADSWIELNFGGGHDENRPFPAWRSQMAATFQEYGGPIVARPGFFLLATIDQENGITMFNGSTSDKWTQQKLNTSDEVAPNTPLAMVPLRFQKPEDISYLYQLPNYELNHVGTDGNGEYSNRSDLMTLEPPTTEGIITQLAGLKWDGGETEMILSLKSDGTVKGFWWTGKEQTWDLPQSQETFDPVVFRGYEEDGKVPVWTAIATTGDGWFYALSGGGRVVEFRNSQDGEDRGGFDYVGIVY